SGGAARLAVARAPAPVAAHEEKVARAARSRGPRAVRPHPPAAQVCIDPDPRPAPPPCGRPPPPARPDRAAEHDRCAAARSAPADAPVPAAVACRAPHPGPLRPVPPVPRPGPAALCPRDRLVCAARRPHPRPAPPQPRARPRPHRLARRRQVRLPRTCRRRRLEGPPAHDPRVRVSSARPHPYLRHTRSPNSAVYHATVSLPPGTLHFRFLIDDSWRVADDLPTAVDDQGSLANYVAVPLPDSPPPPTTAKPPPPRPGHSFWSAADDDDASSAPAPAHPGPHAPAQWTAVLPPELIEAAREEEAYLAASEGHASHGTQRVAGFVPAPNIPPAPGLPRHLDKLILNARPVVQVGAVVGSGAVPPRKGGSSNGGGARKTRDREGRERDRRDGWRDRDRDRERRERRNPPPAPPPSEADVEPDPVPVPVPVPAVVPRSPPHDPAPSTPVPLPASAAASPAPPTPPTPSPASASAPTSRPLTISLDNDDSTVPLTDDASVLPVPSHVVLHHLSTSAIRNGVLAVGTTTRYRKKYLTTIYYKPT
ncbi:hypothetical protein C0993_008757, partial [Termitomyces sp. T159_Od127]